MKIKLKSPYKSIETLATEELPDFAVLIGCNGAGKTQLLEALGAGHAVVPGVSGDEINLFNKDSFRPPNSDRGHRDANHFAKVTADAYLLPQGNGRPLVKVAADVFRGFAAEVEREQGVEAREDFERVLRDEVRSLLDFTVFGSTAEVSSCQHNLYRQALAPLLPRNGGPRSDRPAGFDGNQAALLSTAMKLTAKLPHELTRDDILRAWHYEGETIANDISAVFATYKAEQFTWAHKRVETELVRVADLMTEYRTEHRPPWEILREVLSEIRDAAGGYGLFDFEFSDPEDYELNMGNFERFSFETEMTNRTNGARYELYSLSSGERVLMALCLASFNQYLGRRRPKLLLLDELDAVLHPSMVEALVRTLRVLFVSHGTKVLMTSHSPMTVAALGDADIFRIVRTKGHVEVSRTTRSEAISELSEGLATVDVGLRIAASKEAKVTILTEGHNAKHLKRWVELNFPKDVHVFEDLAQHTSDSQLLSYGRLLGRMSTNTHFVVVWDCDAKRKAETLSRDLPSGAKVTPYALPERPDNAIAKKGIENNYDEKLLAPYSTETRRSDGTLLNRAFDNSLKTEFADHVLREGKPGYFTNFQELRAVVSDILEAPD